MVDLNTKVKYPWFVDGFNTTSVIANELQMQICFHCGHSNEPSMAMVILKNILKQIKLNAKRISKVPTMIYLLKKTALTLEIMRAQNAFIETPNLLTEIELCLKELDEL